MYRLGHAAQHPVLQVHLVLCPHSPAPQLHVKTTDSHEHVLFATVGAFAIHLTLPALITASNNCSKSASLTIQSPGMPLSGLPYPSHLFEGTATMTALVGCPNDILIEVFQNLDNTDDSLRLGRCCCRVYSVPEENRLRIMRTIIVSSSMRCRGVLHGHGAFPLQRAVCTFDVPQLYLSMELVLPDLPSYLVNFRPAHGDYSRPHKLNQIK